MINWNTSDKHELMDIIAFHVEFETIHPFQDGNGRVGRMIMFKECLNNDIIPFIVYDEYKQYYYSGINEWIAGNHEQLSETIMQCQDIFEQNVAYFMGKADYLMTPSFARRQFSDDTAPNNENCLIDVEDLTRGMGGHHL